MAILIGRVVSGVGASPYCTERLHEHDMHKTGHLFPGTLNVSLEHLYALPAHRTSLEKDEYGGAVSVDIVPCHVFDRSAFVLRADQNDAGVGTHPNTIVEIACEVGLRERYGLRDGDAVNIEIPD